MLGGAKRPGLPTGCFVEINGREGAGKTSTTMCLARGVIHRPAGVHRVLCTEDGKLRDFPLPRRVGIIDFEHTFDVEYARAAIPGAKFLEVDRETGEMLNLDEANILLHQPRFMEEGIELFIELVESKEVGAVIIDSVPAMLPREEHEKNVSEATMGLLARSMGKMFRKTISTISRHGVVVILVNQWRDKIGVVFGDPRSAPGGHASKYFDSIRLDVMGANKDPWFPNRGKLCTIKQTKNKITGLRGECTYHLGTGVGLSAEAELTEALCRIDVVKSPGVNAKVSLVLEGKKFVFKNRDEWFAYLSDRSRFAKLQRLAVDRGAPFADAPVAKDFGQDDD